MDPTSPRTPSPTAASGNDTLAHLAAVIESRKPAAGGDPEKSYVARLLHKGPDSFLKKVGEEATEVVLAAKDLQHLAPGPADSPARIQASQALVGEVADLWFHSMIALAHFGLSPAQVLAELARREGLSGLEEKALRKSRQREAEETRDTSSSAAGAQP
ncbi:MAG: phosphoribosyl-ATP diphosphatase [Serpentinimonas sp.]|jgi:phosphoribosyl-ATP pyrophosphohydrolase|nr:phosphoribosyl-ATP diphosphatase [Serpentinimonas sp.]